MEAALARLSLRDRELLLLVGVEGLTPSEAAGVCGLPAVTLRARLHRGAREAGGGDGRGPRGGAGESGVSGMTTWEPKDEVAEDLSALRVHDASPESVERTRARCVAVLAARRKAEDARAGRAAPWRAWLEPALALGLGALYLVEAVTRAVAVYR